MRNGVGLSFDELKRIGIEATAIPTILDCDEEKKKCKKHPLGRWGELYEKVKRGEATKEDIERYWEEAVADPHLLKIFPLGEETRDIKKVVKVTALSAFTGIDRVVVDIDDIEGFKKAFGLSNEEWKRLLSSTYAVKTPRGVHLHFKKPEKEMKNLHFEWGDFKGGKGLITIPPSTCWWCREIQLYVALNDKPLAVLPGWLKEAVEKKEERVPQEGERADGAVKDLGRLKDIIAPYWIKGQRHYLALGLAGVMAKAGIPLERTAEVIEGIAKTAGDEEINDRIACVFSTYRKLKNGEAVAGYTLLEEILPGDVIQRIKGVIGEKIRVPLNKTGTLYVVNDAKQGQIYELKLHNGEEVGGLIYASTAVVSAKEQVDIVTNETTFVVEFTEEGEVTGKLEEIAHSLRERARVFVREEVFTNVLARVIDALRQKGRMKKVRGTKWKGIFLDKESKELISTLEVTSKPVDEERLKTALTLLNEYVDKWCHFKRPHTASVVFYAVASPFSYIKKTHTLTPWKWLGLIGRPDTGKTQDAYLAQVFWGQTPSLEGSASIRSEARLRALISKSAIPVILDEASRLFNDARYDAIVEELKRIWNAGFVEGKFISRNTFRRYPALAPLLFTTNKSLTLTDALKKRICIIAYPTTPVDKTKRKEFEEFWGEATAVWDEIGRATFEIAKRDVEGFILSSDTFAEAGRKILRALYKWVGLTPPEWIDLPIPSSEDYEYDTEEGVNSADVLGYIVQYVIDIAKDYIDRHTLEAYVFERNIAGLINVLRAYVPTLPLAIYSPKDAPEKYLALRREFLDYLNTKPGMEFASLAILKDFLNIPGAEVKSINISSAGWKKVKALIIPLPEVTYILGTPSKPPTAKTLNTSDDVDGFGGDDSSFIDSLLESF